MSVRHIVLNTFSAAHKCSLCASCIFKIEMSYMTLLYVVFIPIGLRFTNRYVYKCVGCLCV